jgi:outer membrane protein OmpA-like peptidoglycan-associated protein
MEMEARMAWFRPAKLFRKLRPGERNLAWHTFHKSLPPLDTIGITNGLGQDGSIWTIDRGFHDFLQSAPPKTLDGLKYFINIGEAVHWDLSDSKPLNPAVPGYHERARDIFVHEMTHVWQFHRGDSVKMRSIYAQHAGAGYKFTRGEPWHTYNVEQQAEVVEAWNRERKDRGEYDELFPYIHYIIRREGQWQLSTREYWSKTLAELQLMLDAERGNGTVTHDGPTRVTVPDDYMVAALSGDVLFDFDKAVVKPEAEPQLAQAAATIRGRITPRLRRILVNGHADSTGNAGYNESLSEKRAEAVVKWLTARGLPEKLLVPQGFGETQPRFPNTTPENRARNRRVEIFMMH